MKRLFAFFAALAFLASAMPAHAGGDEISITAEQLVDHGPWTLKNTSKGKVYEATVTFTVKDGAVDSISIDWGGGYPVDVGTFIKLDGDELSFSHLDAQPCEKDGFRTLTYDFELEEDDGAFYFEGDVTGPRSKCRGGTFEDDSELKPTIQIGEADLNLN